MTKTLYWYDFEAGGANPRVDKPTQFAGIRTDENLNIVGEALVHYCQLPPDYLPHPEACLITGITPQLTLQHGLPEADFAGLIHEQFCQSETTVVGYNNVRYDDEMTRFMFYRNFYDPYAWCWQNNNSRWDLVDLVRACYALRPDGIEWPQRDDGLVSFKLEHLSAANAIDHGKAHDAMSDVYATIGLARLIKQAQPRLYQWHWQLRHKRNVQKLVDEALVQGKPLLHVSAFYGARQGNVNWVLPLGYHPEQPNSLIAWRLDCNPGDWKDASAEEILQSLRTRGEHARPGLITIAVNKCPFLAPVKTLSADRAAFFTIDLEKANRYCEQLQHDSSLRQHLLNTMLTDNDRGYSEPDDVELQLYSGPFFSDQAKSQMEIIRSSSAEQLASLDLNWDDKRLPEMLFRYRARNYPHTLSQPELERWRQHCRQRLTDGSAQHLSLDEFLLKLEQLAPEHEQNDRSMNILRSLYQYVHEL